MTAIMAPRSSSELREGLLSHTASTSSLRTQREVDQGGDDVQQRLLGVGSSSSSVNRIASQRNSIEEGRKDMESKGDGNENDEFLAAMEYELPDGRPESERRQLGSLDYEDAQHLPGSSEPLLWNGSNGHDREEGHDENELDASAKSTLPAVIANMSNSILGAGIIGLPYAVEEAGFFTGVFLLVTLCIVTNWTIRLLVISAKLSGRSTYVGIMEHCYGAPGRIAVAFFQFAFALGGMCACGVITGDTVTPVLRYLLPTFSQSSIGSLFINRQFIITCSSLFVMYPLSLNKDIAKLSHASGMAIAAMSFIVLTVLIRGPLSDPALKGSTEHVYTIIKPKVFEAVGVISFAYVCHQNSHMLYDSLKTPTLDRFNMVVHISTGISLVYCLIMSIAGYLSFTDKTQANILNNLSPSDFMGNLARFCIGMNMTTTLPLECFVCREVLEITLYAGKPFSQVRHVVVTSLLCAVALIVSLSTCDLGIVLEITGGLSATALAFVFPAITYFQLIPGPWHSKRKLPAAACAVFGAVMMVLSLLLALKKLWTGEARSDKVCV